MMDVYQKVGEWPFGYMVLDLHPTSDDRGSVFSRLLMHEGLTRASIVENERNTIFTLSEI